MEEELDYGKTLLSSFLGVLQIYIFLLGGIKSYFKKITTNSLIMLINGLLYNFYIPVYSILEIGRMATILNIKSYYILAVSTFICILLRIIIAYIVARTIGSDFKSLNSYSLMTGFPAVGSLTLVIGKALCTEGNALYGDPLCENILGLMMVNYLMYSIILFGIGFIVQSSTLKQNYILKEKLKFVKYRFLTVKNMHDVYPDYLIHKYIKFNGKLADELYNKFINDNKLITDNKFNYTVIDKTGNLLDAKSESDKANIEINSIERQDTNAFKGLTNIKFDLKSKSMMNKEDLKNNYIKIVEEDKKIYNAIKSEYFVNNESNSKIKHILDEENLVKNNQNIANKLFEEEVKNNCENSININTKNPLPNNNLIYLTSENTLLDKNKIDYNKISIVDNNINLKTAKSKSIIKSIPSNQFAYLGNQYYSESNIKLSKKNSKNQDYFENKHIKFVLDNLQKNEDLVFNLLVNQLTTKYFNKTIVKKRRTNSFEVFRNKKRHEYIELMKNKEKLEDDIYYKDKQIINNYYQKLFNTIYEAINSAFENKIITLSNKEKLNHDLNLEHNLLNSQVNDKNVPNFHVIDSLRLTSKSDVNLVNKLWIDYIEEVSNNKKLDVSLVVKTIEVNICTIIQKMMNPPVLGCILGLYIGMSGLRDILFSKNHYVSNLFEVIPLISRSYVPLLFITTGNAMMKAPSFNKYFTLTRKQFLVSFFLCYILYPALGIGFLYFWIKVFKGIVETSKVFRFSLFVPFCVPIGPNFILVINVLDKFFLDEFSYSLSRHFYFMIISTTLLILLFFAVIN